MVKKKNILSKYEREIEDNLHLYKPVKDQDKERKLLVEAARAHVKNRKKSVARNMPLDKKQ